MSAKVPIHLVLKSEKAGGNTSFLRKEREIMDLAFDLGRVYGVKVYKIAVQFNHIHFVIRAPREENYKAWIRRLTSEIVKALKAGKGFFTFRPFTKILSWGRQLQASLKYLEINIPETCRLTRHQAKDILQKPSYFGPPP